MNFTLFSFDIRRTSFFPKSAIPRTSLLVRFKKIIQIYHNPLPGSTLGCSRVQEISGALSGIRTIDGTSWRTGEKGAGIRAGKKTVQIAIEQDGEVKRILEKVAASKQADLEAWEMALRAAVLSAGAKVLEELLQGIGLGREPRAIVCNCGARMESQGLKLRGC